MAIRVQKEPADYARLSAEQCRFCKLNTRYWHIKTNTPVCLECAKIKCVEDIRAQPESV